MRWAATLSRWWHDAFTRNPYARRTGSTPFAHLMEPAEESPATDAPSVRPPGHEA
jgi:hypothetical protein